MNEQVKKRVNPFDRPIAVEQEEEKVVEEVVAQPTPQIQPQPVQQVPQETYYYQQPVQQAPKTTRKQAKPQYIPQMDAPKEKYTATMDVTLRRSIKIFCATNGKMFSEFIEDACREKLSREGGKY